MKPRKIILIILATGFIGLSFFWFNVDAGFSTVRSWFDGAQNVRLTALELEVQGSRLLVTKTNLLMQIDFEMKRKRPSSGPSGRRCTAKVQINGKWSGEVEVSCNPSERIITVGVPTNDSLFRSEFGYARLDVSKTCAESIYRAIDASYELIE